MIDQPRPRFFIRNLPETIIIVCGCVLAVLWWQVRNHFPFDDTFITFRYAKHLAEGFGIVWNVGGPHTEGYTNFLYVLLLSLFSLFHLDLVPSSQILGCVFVIMTAVVICRIVAGALRDTACPMLSAGLAVGLYLLDPFVWFNALSGLETSLFVLLLVAVLQRIVEEKDTRITYLFVFAATLTRPEGAIMSVVLLVLRMRRSEAPLQKRIAEEIRKVLYFALPLLLYAAWKLYYFGNLLPNSFYVKVAQPNSDHAGALLRGYFPGSGTLRLFYMSVWYLLVLWVGGLLFRRHDLPRAVGRLSLAITLWCGMLSLFYLYSLLLQPQYGRFTHSIEVMLIVVAAIGFGLIADKSATNKSGTRSNVSFFAYIEIAGFLGFHLLMVYFIRDGLTYLNSDTRYETGYKRLADVFRQIPDHQSIEFAWSDAGILPYYSEMKHLDVVGLNTTSIAHARTSSEALNLIVAARPDMIFIPLEPKKTSDTAVDSPSSGCSTIVRWGHGFIGSNYPALLMRPELGRYRPIATIPEIVYDLNVLVDTLSPHYRDIELAIAPRIGKDPQFAAPVRCMK